MAWTRAHHLSWMLTVYRCVVLVHAHLWYSPVQCKTVREFQLQLHVFSQAWGDTTFQLELATEFGPILVTVWAGEISMCAIYRKCARVAKDTNSSLIAVDIGATRKLPYPVHPCSHTSM